MGMNLIYNLQSNVDPTKNTIFLAGGTSRTDTSNSWRKEAVKYLEQFGFGGNVVIPEPENGFLELDTFDKDEQIKWERDMLVQANVILFWIPRDLEKLPCFTTNIEFGEWYNSSKVVYGRPDNAEKMDYIDFMVREAGGVVYYTLEHTVGEAISRLGREPKIWFTSDTHFSQDRTRVLSRRPFKNIELMDRTLMSNWNGLVYAQDTVYHLGDFGEPDIINKLSAKEIKLLPGNYDTPKFFSKLKQLDVFDRVKKLESWHVFIDKDNNLFNLVHEPENCDVNMFNLFGHIHQLQQVKRYGLNVGCDCYGYKPIDLETINFYRVAIEQHYDNNVFE
jgi:calcineurin-like phosphoesterase family protein